MGKGMKFLCVGISAAACLRSSSASDSIFGGFVKAPKNNAFGDVVAPPHGARSTAKDIISSRITETGNDKFVVSVANTRHTSGKSPKFGYHAPVPEPVYSIQDDGAAAPATKPAKEPKFGHHEPAPAKQPKFGYQAPVDEPVYSIQDNEAMFDAQSIPGVSDKAVPQVQPRGVAGFEAPLPQSDFGVQNVADVPVYIISNDYPTPPPGQNPRPEPRAAFGYQAVAESDYGQDEGAPITKPAMKPKFGHHATEPDVYGVRGIPEVKAAKPEARAAFGFEGEPLDGPTNEEAPEMMPDGPEADFNPSADDGQDEGAPITKPAKLPKVSFQPASVVYVSENPTEPAIMDGDEVVEQPEPRVAAEKEPEPVEEGVPAEEGAAVFAEDAPPPEGEDEVDMGVDKMPVYQVDSDGVPHLISEDSVELSAEEVSSVSDSSAKRMTAHTHAKQVVQDRVQHVGATPKFSVTISKPRGMKHSRPAKKAAKTKKSAGSKKSSLRGSA